MAGGIRRCRVVPISRVRETSAGRKRPWVIRENKSGRNEKRTKNGGQRRPGLQMAIPSQGS